MKISKRLIWLPLVLTLGGCLGHSSRDNQLVGQVKRVLRETPLRCENWVHADLSLGTVRNGVGSMSTEDLWLWVRNDADVAVLERAQREGLIVRITYDIARFRAWWSCAELEEITSVEVMR